MRKIFNPYQSFVSLSIRLIGYGYGKKEVDRLGKYLTLFLYFRKKTQNETVHTRTVKDHKEATNEDVGRSAERCKINLYTVKGFARLVLE